MDKNPLNYGQNVVMGNLSSLGKLSIWAKNLHGQFVLFGQIVNLGKKSLGKMYFWANCNIGHEVFGQNVTLGNITLGILKSWAFQLSIRLGFLPSKNVKKAGKM